MKNLIVLIILLTSAAFAQNPYNRLYDRSIVWYDAGFTDTVTSTVAGSVDTLSHKLWGKATLEGQDTIKTWWQYSIIADDTIEVSYNVNFPDWATQRILPDIPVTSPMLYMNRYKNLWIRQYGTGTARYYLKFTGN